jgi:hypothetical protein
MRVLTGHEERCNDRSALWSYEYEIGVNSLITQHHGIIAIDETLK